MNDDDPLVVAGQYRYNQLVAAEMQVQANIAAASAQGDLDSMSENIQTLGNIRQEKRNLTELHNEHIASKTPRIPEPLNDQERLAKPVEKMDWSDAYNMSKKSHSNLRYTDPAETERRFNEGFSKGMAHIAAHPTATTHGKG